MATAQLFAELYDLTREPARVEWDQEVLRFGCWLDGGGEPELVGSGLTEAEALEDALATARGWSA